MAEKLNYTDQVDSFSKISYQKATLDIDAELEQLISKQKTKLELSAAAAAAITPLTEFPKWALKELLRLP